MTASSEKAKCEFIIAPTLLEVESSHHNQIAIYSGKNLEADSANSFRVSKILLLAEVLFQRLSVQQS